MRPDSSRWLAIALALPLVALPATRAGATDAALVDQPARPPSLGLEAAFAVRGNRVPSAGFDAFSTNDGLTQTTLAVSYRLRRSQMSGLAFGFEWRYGSASSHARGTESSLAVQGLAFTVQGRRTLGKRWLAYGRIAPGAVRAAARLYEPSGLPSSARAFDTPALTQTKWLPTVDGAAGVAFRMGELSGERTPAFGIWLTGEGGYGYTPSYALALAARAAPAAGRTAQPLSLGQLSLSGAFLRFGVALTF
ncbi:MAG TPA: hypothetical protein VGP07_11270 [Polyangia bacterium]|jgi:hypothetical protein